MSKVAKTTPMMQQYWEVKHSLPPNTLLLFRLGDFYELFHADAEIGAKILGITLTKRNDYPMAGIPFHAAENYLAKLLAAGRKVAIVDQLEEAQPGKLVKRSLTRILSPGTTIAANQLQPNRNHYLAALDWNRAGFHAAWLDLSTGEFQIATDVAPANLLPVLHALAPAELVLAEGALAEWKAHPHEPTPHAALAGFCAGRAISEIPGYHFEISSGARLVMETLGVLNLQGFGLTTQHGALGAAGALIHYATENLCAKPENIRAIREYRSAGTLLIDPATLRNLEILQSARGSRQGSLLAAMDATCTAAGARLLEQYLIAPRLDLAELQRRQACVAALVAAPAAATDLREQLGRVRDLARILGRLQHRLRNPRELGGVRDTLEQLPAVIATLRGFASTPVGSSLATTANGDAHSTAFASEGPTPSIAALAARITDLPDLRDLLRRALRDELPGALLDGGYIQSGFDVELDRLLSLKSDNQHWLAELERTEQERTGIKNLKVRFNGAFGYFIEITKSNLASVPADYIRKQTTVGGERFITEGLRQKEKEIFHAEENAHAREQFLFGELVNNVLDQAESLRATALALAELDVFLGWATLAREWDYCRPVLDDSDRLEIREGRHPVVEQMMKQEVLGLAGTHSFVPNDTEVAASGPQILLITGPNMAGKSTYIRQVALITLMAQVGSFVPAKACHVGLVDRIFSRVGASDDLARGNSTFMVEMNETANILNHATDRSLIILDEIGRGTSTYDGVSIAWAVVEHLHRDADRGPRTLFATHYQELTQLEKHLGRLKNLSVAVKEWNDEIVFVRRVIDGAADRSYGIQVARLAGLPREVIARASEIMGQLESDEAVVTVSAPAPKSRPKRTINVAPADTAQMDLF
jgi:DNA mismatch repair protein MutS